MDRRNVVGFGLVEIVCCVFVGLLVSRRLEAQPQPAALAGFNTYVAEVEERLNRQHLGRDTLVAGVADGERSRKLRAGELVVEQLTPVRGGELPGALLHDWRGTAFVPGANAGDFESLLRTFDAYPKVFAPQVLGAKVTSQQGDRLKAWMRVRQKHVLTVVMDTSYDVAFGRLDGADGFSTSRSTRIYEIDGAGTAKERALPDAESHGFLWRLNSYWSYEERDGGLYIQIESVSLSRSIPPGLGWAVRPFVQSVPCESLEFTLRSAAGAVRR